MGILGCTLKYIYIILYLQPLDTLENLWQRPGALLHVWWFTSPLQRDGEITSPGLGEPWLVIQRCWLPWLLGWSPRVCRVATFIGSVGYELQPIFFSLMESSIRAVSTFWKLSWGLENDNTLQKNDNIYLYTKTWKTVIHSSKKWLGAILAKHWPWPIWTMDVSAIDVYTHVFSCGTHRTWMMIFVLSNRIVCLLYHISYIIYTILAIHTYIIYTLS